MLKCYCYWSGFLCVLNGSESNLKPFGTNGRQTRISKGSLKTMQVLLSAKKCCAVSVFLKTRMDEWTKFRWFNKCLSAHTLSWDRHIFYTWFIYIGYNAIRMYVTFWLFHFVVLVVITDGFSDYVNILLLVLCSFFQ